MTSFLNFQSSDFLERLQISKFSPASATKVRLPGRGDFFGPRHAPVNIFIWQPLSIYDLNEIMPKVESVQYRAALVTTGAWRATNKENLYDELG